ncbi:MAG: peptidoglycan-binding protein LysM [Crocinitomix sp.]|nr:peptidoglycan-binding protein LysM [Crocinitomix sp.]
MGSFSFTKDAGEKVFKENKVATEKTELILAHLKKYDLIPDSMTASFEGEKLVVAGEVNTIHEKNKILATAGNIHGISEIEDRITVAGAEAGSTWGNGPTAEVAATLTEASPIASNEQFYTVKKGDYLSKIAKAVYGNANKYPLIFEANKPMLQDANLIYAGQVLVIPPLEA